SSISRRRRASSNKRSRSVTGRRGVRLEAFPGRRAPFGVEASSPVLKSVPKIHTPTAMSGIINNSHCIHCSRSGDVAIPTIVVAAAADGAAHLCIRLQVLQIVIIHDAQMPVEER